LAAVCRAHLSLGFVALAWAVAVPLMRGKTALPLPCTTSATAIFCAISGTGVANGRVTQHSLQQFVKLSKAALFLVRASRPAVLASALTPVAGCARLLPASLQARSRRPGAHLRCKTASRAF